jgi:cofilin
MAAEAIIENHLKTGGEQVAPTQRVVAASVDDGCGELFTQFKIRRKHKYVTFKIELETSKIVVDQIGAKKGTLDELRAVLPYTECRYAVYDHEYHTPDGRLADKLFFMSWMPHNATPYSKMAYASGKSMLREKFDGVIDTTCAALDQIYGAFGIGGKNGGDDDDEDCSDDDDDDDPDNW